VPNKHSFTKAEKWAVYSASDGHCFWCRRPLDYVDCTIDHVIPETMLQRPEKLAEVVEAFSLGADFQVNEFCNWVPAHQSCNRSKSDTVFDVSPVMVLALHKVKQKAVQARIVHAKTLTSRATSKLIAELEIALERQTVPVERIEAAIRETRPTPVQGEAWVPSSPLLFAGWVISQTSGNIAHLSRGGRFGYTYVGPGSGEGFRCPHCGLPGPWNGVVCQSCGMMSDPTD
jgi:hypothetical protein